MTSFKDVIQEKDWRRLNYNHSVNETAVPRKFLWFFSSHSNSSFASFASKGFLPRGLGQIFGNSLMTNQNEPENLRMTCSESRSSFVVYKEQTQKFGSIPDIEFTVQPNLSIFPELVPFSLPIIHLNSIKRTWMDVLRNITDRFYIGLLRHFAFKF